MCLYRLRVEVAAYRLISFPFFSSLLFFFCHFSSQTFPTNSALSDNEISLISHTLFFKRKQTDSSNHPTYIHLLHPFLLPPLHPHPSFASFFLTLFCFSISSFSQISSPSQNPCLLWSSVVEREISYVYTHNQFCYNLHHICSVKGQFIFLRHQKIHTVFIFGAAPLDLWLPRDKSR